jgi:Tol biopolymer transport system component
VAFGFFPAGAGSPDSGHIYAKIGGLGGYDSLIVQGGSDPRISPDGEMLAYVSRGDLWVCSVDGSQQRRLTTDGGSILESFGSRSLSSGEDQRRFEQFEKQWLFAPYRDPAWSPDSRHLIFSSLSGTDSEGRPNYDIWLLELDSGRRVQITTNGSADVLPRFDPAGKFIYFVSNRGRQWAIWRLSPPELESTAP